ncbi:C4-dicarboxylate TRAP transporter substrate-binding protein [Pseudomonas paeninsulae]|uniref:C4-dicarboxylate TRAP transporter substrate-binding protein n=1 Tax=Pseudomonas paeninsulae TaxID=3110772 RepID=UPI002D787752|nr:C4-dicarboxylate TRAP transporter substrate-binding protein [Pseudomonas sp. IT1137]
MKKVIAGFATACLITLTAIPFASAAPLSIKVAYENNPGEPLDQVMHYWADLLKTQSHDEIELELYPSSRLGSKKDVTEQAMMGMNVITITDVGFLTDFDPDLGILFGPYLTDNQEQLFKIYQSDWFKQKDQALREKGIHIVMSNYLYGVRQILAKKPIRTPADLQGLKIRVPNNPMQVSAIQAMGATPTPMPLGEVYPALTQGVIDGVENPVSVLYGQKLHEQAKYLSMVNYLTNTSLFVGGEAFFSTLSAEQQKLIHDTAYQAGLHSQTITSEADQLMVEKMKQEGVEVIYPDTVPFKQASAVVYTQYPQWTLGLYDRIQKELAE